MIFRQPKKKNYPKVWVQFKGESHERIFQKLKAEAEGMHRSIPEMVRYILDERYSGNGGDSIPAWIKNSTIANKGGKHELDNRS